MENLKLFLSNVEQNVHLLQLEKSCVVATQLLMKGTSIKGFEGDIAPAVQCMGDFPVYRLAKHSKSVTLDDILNLTASATATVAAAPVDYVLVGGNVTAQAVASLLGSTVMFDPRAGESYIHYTKGDGQSVGSPLLRSLIKADYTKYAEMKQTVKGEKHRVKSIVELDDGAVVFAKKGVILCAGQGSLAVAATVAAATTGEQKENEPHSFHHIVVEAPSEAAPGFYAGFQQPEYSGHVTVGDGKVRGFLSFTFHRDAEAESRVTKIVRMLASGGGGATTPTTTDSRHYGCGGLTSSFDEGGVHREIQHLFAADWSTVRELPSLQVPFHKQTIERATKFVYGMAALSSDV